MNSLIIGKTTAGVPVPVQVDANGVLQSNLAFSGSITLAEVKIDQTTPNANKVVVVSSGLPTGASTEATLLTVSGKLTDAATATLQTAGNSTLSTISSRITACNTGAVNVTTSALPAGAATEAKQPSLGTAGSPSVNVITVQGITNGTAIPISGTVTANTQVMTVANSTAFEASRVIKSSAGTIFSLSGYNSGPAQFIQFFNSTTVPANATVPVAVFAVSAASGFFLEWEKGLPFSTGISISNSSTAATKTIGSADCFLTATYS
jgi:hypothetical protein